MAALRPATGAQDLLQWQSAEPANRPRADLGPSAIGLDALRDDGDTTSPTPSISFAAYPGGPQSALPEMGASGTGSGGLLAAGASGLDTPTATPTATPMPVPGCDLYPIALHTQSLAALAPGDVIPDTYNGTQPGNFGWLSCTGNPSEPALVASLTPPGNSETYVNPDNPNDHVVSVGDEVRGKPGVSNSSAVRAALKALKLIDITVRLRDGWESRSTRSASR